MRHTGPEFPACVKVRSSCRLAIVKRKNAITEPQPTPIAALRRFARIAKALASGATVTDIAQSSLDAALSSYTDRGRRRV